MCLCVCVCVGGGGQIRRCHVAASCPQRVFTGMMLQIWENYCIIHQMLGKGPSINYGRNFTSYLDPLPPFCMLYGIKKVYEA